ncbi:hypothetical protein [Mesorhizobium sp. NZP2077]|uniref:hypothetical protein n=1 Tax=Mesorhizobium sp. NZP2077 TaxID=2483404 RepID=UPI0015550185|nr:hypothetical protein [Mesorhizobium sp. NZP2077]QKC80989.1 hypothetical protein EB232_04370 [Mesorhizobium sp. NZP2077]QKD14394.1 hypothetical protein HGP13_04290 [Mesorhizobium sp. NZP2077]
MTDSDNSTTLASVTHSRRDRQVSNAYGYFDDSDPAILLQREWLRAEYASHVLCRLQQRLERRVLDAAAPDAMDEKVGYSIACQAEVEAATAALKLQDNLPCIQARSLLGIVAKLEIIAGADRDIDDPTDFPWPHIASVLDDLKKIAGSPPLGRPERSVVQTDCRRYQAMAADMIGLEKQAANLRLGRSSVLRIKAE